MAVARSLLVDNSQSGFYHCISRCVRRAHLCGDGFDHRRDWIRSRLRQLTRIFAIDACAFAVLSNHLHLLLRTNPEAAKQWSATQIARRWLQLFPGPAGRLPRYSRAFLLAVRELAADTERIEVLRERLSSLSWFMRCLCEPIARRANREDDCTGRFWEGRFKCHPLLDLAAVLACMVYIDLNLVRAGLASTPEGSDHTSVRDRVIVRRLFRRGSGRRAAGAQLAELLPDRPPGQGLRHAEDGIWLVPIESRGARRRDGTGRRGLFGFSLEKYLELVDATGRLIRQGRGAIPSHMKPILERLDIDTQKWAEAMKITGRFFGSAIGSSRSLVREASRRGRTWIVGAMDVYRDGAPAG